jgi:hypothetical protein
MCIWLLPLMLSQTLIKGLLFATGPIITMSLDLISNVLP